MTAERDALICAALAGGMRKSEVSRLHGVSRPTIDAIIKRAPTAPTITPPRARTPREEGELLSASMPFNAVSTRANEPIPPHVYGTTPEELRLKESIESDWGAEEYDEPHANKA